VHAERCSFTNVKEAFQTRGGGTVELEYNTFLRTEVALKLDDRVSTLLYSIVLTLSCTIDPVDFVS
jgi:hypothetical protein|tara:strand:- start:332 stop:529 length:198 start_codon:yes stop_codon:yes gene_type:complete